MTYLEPINLNIRHNDNKIGKVGVGGSSERYKGEQKCGEASDIARERIYGLEPESGECERVRM